MPMSRNMYPTPERDKTRYTISITWPDGSAVYDCPIFLPEPVVTMLQAGQVQPVVAIWKHLEPQSVTGFESVAELRRLWCSPPSPAPVTDGSQEQRRPDYYGLRDTPNIFGALYSSAYTPEADPETSLDCNGRK
jgi:hypothetical protein